MFDSRRVAMLLFGLAALVPTVAGAERPSLQVYPDSGRPEVWERDLAPHRPATPSTHGFIPPLSKQTDRGQLGIAGWTSPNPPVGPRVLAEPGGSGWLGFGFAAEWGTPLSRSRN